MTAKRPLSALTLLLVAGSGTLGCTTPVDSSPASTAGAGGGGAVGTGGGNFVGGGGGAVAGGGGTAPTSGCAVPQAPLRRLTRFEYNNTVSDLAKVTDAPANNFPPEEVGSGFGTDVNKQSVPDLLAEKYVNTAGKIARAMTAPQRISELSPCASSPTPDNEAGCVRSVIDTFVPRAYRRPLEAGEADSLSQLFQTVRTAGNNFTSSLTAVLEAVLQSPNFLYRPEFGTQVAGRPELMRPTDYEMATRLSYLFLGSMPDDALRAAAAAGALATPEGVKAEATRLFNQQGARKVVRHFFDNLLPIQGLAALSRSDKTFMAKGIGRLMREETQTFLENEVFGGGTWPQALTAPYTYVNETLAAFYGISGVTGAEFRKVPLDGIKRAGLMTQGGIVAGPVHSNETNPVVRGGFVLSKIMCFQVSPPPASLGPIVPPDVAKGGTARDRFKAHSADPRCGGCHALLDPIGFSLENFNAVGQWQEQENQLPINVSVDSPQLGSFNGAVELGKKLAAYPEAQQCFATNWANYAYGRGSEEQEACTMQRLQDDFKSSGYNIKELLLDLTQTETFLYLPAVRK